MNYIIILDLLTEFRSMVPKEGSGGESQGLGVRGEAQKQSNVLCLCCYFLVKSFNIILNFK